TLQLTDSANVMRDAELVMVSDKQINYVIPDRATPGPGKIVIKNDAGITIAEGPVDIAESSPALFTSGDSKSAVGVTSANGSVSQSIDNSDGSARLIGPGAPWAPNTITLLGTGIRYASDVRVLIGGQELTPISVRPSSTPGVDEVSFRVPTNNMQG